MFEDKEVYKITDKNDKKVKILEIRYKAIQEAIDDFTVKLRKVFWRNRPKRYIFHLSLPRANRQDKNLKPLAAYATSLARLLLKIPNKDLPIPNTVYTI